MKFFQWFPFTDVDPLDSEEDLNNLDITKIFPVPQEDLDALMKVRM